MNIQEIYQNKLQKIRENSNLLNNLSIESSKNKNFNQIERNKILIALFNDLQKEDYSIVNFIFTEEQKLRQSKLEPNDYEVDTLYFAAFLLSKFSNIDDIWKFLNSKEIDFDSSIGFDAEYFLSFGVNKVYEYLENTKKSSKKKILEIITDDGINSKFTQNEIEEWKIFKQHYFSVFEFPIKDKIDFAFQAKEYDYLKELLPNWVNQKSQWTEYQNLTSIGIGRTLNLDNFLLESLINYNNRFKNSVRVKEYKKEIEILSKKLNRTESLDKKSYFKLWKRIKFWKNRK